jgi:hypothetical protein
MHEMNNNQKSKQVINNSKNSEEVINYDKNSKEESVIMAKNIFLTHNDKHKSQYEKLGIKKCSLFVKVC